MQLAVAVPVVFVLGKFYWGRFPLLPVIIPSLIHTHPSFPLRFELSLTSQQNY